MPSMPMLTTPARSQNTPESAPSVNGVATAIVVASILVMINKGGCFTCPTITTKPKRTTTIKPMKVKRFQSIIFLASPAASEYHALAFGFDAVDVAYDRVRRNKEQD